MPYRITILEGHHDAVVGHLTRALADAYANGATAAGHVVRRAKLGQLEFPLPRLSAKTADAALADMLAPAREAILAADHVMLILPTLFDPHPRAVKAFFEQVGRIDAGAGIASKRARARLWGGRSVRIVATMGIPGAFYRMFQRAIGLKAERWSLFEFLGIRSIRGAVLGVGNDDMPDRIQTWLRDMRRLGAEDVRLGMSKRPTATSRPTAASPEKSRTTAA